MMILLRIMKTNWWLKMSKLSLYDATFPFPFDNLIEYIETKDNHDLNSLKVIKTRLDFYELKFTYKSIYTEEYLDINNNINHIDKLFIQEIFFRIYNRSNNNLIIFNEPRSILKLKNYLSKVTNFKFSLIKNSLNLNDFLDKNIKHIDYVSRIDVRDIIYADQIFEKKILYTQNRKTNLPNILHNQLNPSSFKIFKIEFFFKNMPTSKVTLTYDSKIMQKTENLDSLLNIILDIF